MLIKQGVKQRLYLGKGGQAVVGFYEQLLRCLVLDLTQGLSDVVSYCVRPNRVAREHGRSVLNLIQCGSLQTVGERLYAVISVDTGRQRLGRVAVVFQDAFYGFQQFLFTCRHWLFLLGLLAVLCSISPQAQSSTLDEALALVRAHHPALAASRAVLAEQSRQHDWNARVTLAYTQKGTEFGGAGGPNAGVQLAIPLFDRKHELEVSKAKADFAAADQQITAAFLTDAMKHAEQGGAAQRCAAKRDLLRDRLTYRKKRVEEGLDEADALWREAEAVQAAEHEHASAVEALDRETERLAREYGGTEWKRLRDLLAEHAKPRP